MLGGSGLPGVCVCVLTSSPWSFPLSPFQASSDVALVNLGLMLCPAGDVYNS